MFHSKLYKMCYPFKSCSDIYVLGPQEKRCLIDYIKHYPGHISDKLLKTRRYGGKIEGWESPKGWRARLKASVLPSTGLVDVLVELQENCNDLISRIEKEEPLTDSDLANINMVLYANKYCCPLSWFLVPIPDGRATAVMK